VTAVSIGEVLATARADAGMTVEDVSRATRIRAQLISAIEHDDFAACGGAVYARGHIRAICTALNLDSEALIKAFDRRHSAEVAGPGIREVFEHEVVAKADRTGPNWTAAMAVAAAVLLTVALIGLFTKNGPTTPVTTDAGLAPRGVQTSAPVVTPSLSASPTTDPVALLPGVTVRLRVIGSKSWVGVVADGKQVFQGTLTSGQQKDFSGHDKVSLVLGSAGDVALVVNGRDLGSPGKVGEVARLAFEPESAASGSG
jgi:transcriptional regulator with XRE-family HTH domain